MGNRQQQDDSTIRLGGLNMNFPYVPYGIQKAMLAKIAVTLTNKEHSLIESPTGTGKTLVLLCASLAWQKQSKADQTPLISARLRRQLAEERRQKLEKRPCSCGRRPNRTELDELKEAKKVGTKGKCIDEDDCSESACKKVKTNDTLESSPYFNKKSKQKEPEFIIIDSDDECTAIEPKENFKQDNEKKIVNDGEIEIIEDFNGAHQKHLSSSESGKNISDIIEDEMCKNCQAIKIEDDYNDELGHPNTRVKVSKIPRIYYGTRTHKQITQVVRELKKTAYKDDLKMCILSSRDRTCVNDDVRDQPDRNDRCQELVKNKSKTSMSKNKSSVDTCKFYRDSNAMAAEFERIFEEFKNDAWDIEDAVKFAKDQCLCPYYGVRSIQDQADITFCPYNYLLDPNIRKALNINLNNAVIIFDEAHNIEDICRDSASFVIDTQQIDEILTTINRAAPNYIQGSTVRDAYDFFKNLFTDIKAFIVKFKFEPMVGGQDGDCLARHIMLHQEMFNVLEQINLGAKNLKAVKENLAALRGDDDESNDKRNDESQDLALSNNEMQYITQLANTLDFLHSANGKYRNDYRCIVSKHLERIRQNQKTPNRTTNDDVYAFRLSLLCMNPGIAFEKIHSLAWSVIVASGTLSPVESLKTELGCQFAHVFEGSHVIDDDRIFAAILSTGPHRIDLNCAYTNSLKLDFQDEIGIIVRDVCQSVPNGVLCFFPSYDRMENLYQRWFSKGYIKDIQASGKKLFREQKSYTAAKFEEELQKYHRCAKGRGALLFAVFRGKVSEGIDFSDTAARAVITIGIPYPNIREITIGLKKEYNDRARRERPHLMNGGDWYASQAFRALNQALGRCIRHKDDWGAIIMIDSRLRGATGLNNISKWIRRVVSIPNDYESVKRSLIDFVNRRTIKEEN